MIVLDPSAAIAIARMQPEGMRLRSLMLEQEKVLAPDILHAEVVHALSKYVRGEYVSREKALDLLKEMLGLVDELVSADSLDAEVLSESLRLGHSSYDMLYFVLARRTASTLFTLDRKLQELCVRNGVDCVCGMTVDSEAWTVRAETVEGPCPVRNSPSV